MDTKRLETIRITALDHVQRCRPTYPSSTTCRYWHERSLLRYGDPCTRDIFRYRRFAFKVTRGSEGTAPIYAFDLIQAAIDTALLELLIDRRTRRLAGYRAFVEEANKAIGPGSAAQTSRWPEVNVLMRLIRRKNKLIDKCRALRHDATDASPPVQLSLTEFMQTVLEVAKEDIYDVARRVAHSSSHLGVLIPSYLRRVKT